MKDHLIGYDKEGMPTKPSVRVGVLNSPHDLGKSSSIWSQMETALLSLKFPTGKVERPLFEKTPQRQH